VVVLGLVEALTGGWATEVLQARAAAAALACWQHDPRRANQFAELKRRPEPDLSGGLALTGLHYDHNRYLTYLRALGDWLRDEAGPPVARQGRYRRPVTA
jgi:hypothetical protein